MLARTPTSPSTQSAARRLTRVAGSAVLAALIAVPAAHAGSWEVVSRGSGADGWAPFAPIMQGGGVGNSGRYAVLSSVSQGTMSLYVRDIVANTTVGIGKPGDRIAGFDRSETKMLVYRAGGLAIVTTTGGVPDRVLPTQGEVETAAISGDGNTVVFARPGGSALYKLSVANGSITSYDVGGNPQVGPRSVSDNGQVLASAVNFTAGAAVVGGKVTKLATPALVSPDGGTVVTYSKDAQGFRDGVELISAASGARRTFRIGYGSITWVAPDASTLYVSAPLGNAPTTQVLNTASGTASPLGGTYDGLLGNDLTNPDEITQAVSRNGRYALLGIGGFAGSRWAEVDLTGGDLPGDQEPAPASSYLWTNGMAMSCDAPEVIASLGTPAPWIAEPRSGRITVLADGRVVALSRVLPKGDAEEPALNVPLPKGTKSIRVLLSVVDADGRTLRHDESYAPTSFCGPIL